MIDLFRLARAGDVDVRRGQLFQFRGDFKGVRVCSMLLYDVEKILWSRSFD